MPHHGDRISKLAELETFDPQVFVDDVKATQHVCDFVLTLALVFNDLRDLITAQQAIQTVRPADTSVSPALGEHFGLHSHWLRSMVGLLNELAKVIQDNAAATEDPLFRKVVKSLRREDREAWDSTVTAALETTAQGDRFGRMIYFARNKVAFHYDRKEIARAYKTFFFKDNAGPPYLSRDDSMAGTRFYFADAAAEEYLMKAAGASTGSEFFDAGWKILPEIGHALREVVIRFVNTRGYGWRKAAT